MRFPRHIAGLGLALLTLSCAWAQSLLAPADWAVQAQFPAEPKSDEFRKSTDQGDRVTHRYYLEQDGRRFMAARFQYPVAPSMREQEALYKKSVEELMGSRPGELKSAHPFSLGDYTGLRLIINQVRDKTVREVRLLQVGASLYVLSAEWPAAATSAVADGFLASVALRPGYGNPREVEDRDRWRELRSGRFTLRYDATRWYRDPTDSEAGIFNLLRVDKLAEAQMIAEPEPLKSPTMEESVLATARESAESVALRHRGRKTRSGTEVEELEFTVRAEGTTYINHGYFYTGPAGALQLRSWSPEKSYAQVSGDITELLDGLRIEVPAAASANAGR